MRIRWTPAAAADLQNTSDYLKEHHPRYRDPTMRKLYGMIRELKRWPGRGRPGREAETRGDFVPPRTGLKARRFPHRRRPVSQGVRCETLPTSARSFSIG